LREPRASLDAYEPLLTDDDPWVRATARLQLGKSVNGAVARRAGP
jgi:hypothetical protein